MSLGILSQKRAMGAVDNSAQYPWLRVSSDTRQLQIATNQALRAAGFCLLPETGILDGGLCGARSHLTIHSQEYFGNDIVFTRPSECLKHADEQWMPIPGCFTPTELKAGQKIGTTLTSNEWIVLGGAASLVLAVVIAAKRKG